jgi:ribosomal protein L7/L12
MSKHVIQLEDGRVYHTTLSESYMEDIKTEVLDMSLKMIRKVKTAYGEEASSKMINSFREVFGTEWSQKVVLSILERGHDDDYYIAFTVDTRHFNKPINLIKAIRMGSGMGLYDAKKAYDNLRDLAGQHVEKHPSEPYNTYPCIRMFVAERLRVETERELRNAGVVFV